MSCDEYSFSLTYFVSDLFDCLKITLKDMFEKFEKTYDSTSFNPKNYN